MDQESFNTLLREKLPCVWEGLHVQVVEVAEDHVTVRIPMAGNGNDKGTMFAGAAYSALVVAGWCLVMNQAFASGFKKPWAAIVDAMPLREAGGGRCPRHSHLRGASRARAGRAQLAEGDGADWRTDRIRRRLRRRRATRIAFHQTEPREEMPINRLARITPRMLQAVSVASDRKSVV